MRIAWIAATLLLTGCPERIDDEQPESKPAECAKVGQRCEFAPGKLGSCVARDDCRGTNCFVCQSQH